VVSEDLTGLDVSHAVMESVYQQYYEEPRFRPSPLTRQRLAAGLLGRKTGEGFYRYVDGKQQMPDEPHIVSVSPCPVWISQDDPESAKSLTQLVNEAGWPLETSAQPTEQALCLLTPFGEDATRCALRQGLNAQQCVAVDMLAGLEKRRSLMTTPLTHSAFIQAGCSLLNHDGTPVSTLQDSNGFVLQRIIACIVNVGADIAQQGVAEPATIDRAVELGLGYPFGPLRMGDHYGASRIMTILNNLLEATGDPRYRPSPWLRRRASLRMPLTTA
jgi:3-hydroxybutyryl-CoA dehydrogenase